MIESNILTGCEIGNPKRYDIKPKPPGYLTVNQWKQQGKTPRDMSVIEEYYCVKKDGSLYLDAQQQPVIYKYISPENVVSSLPVEQKVKPLNSQAIISKSNNIIVFDSETTGYSPAKGAELLQISIYAKKGLLFESYLKPHRAKTWPQAMMANHISPKMVANAPYPEEVRDKIKNIFDQAEIIIGHNVMFDVRFVETCLKIPIAVDKIRDTMKIFKEMQPEGKHNLQAAIERFCPERMEEYLRGAHDASTDTKCTLYVYEAMLKEQQIKTNHETHEENEVER